MLEGALCAQGIENKKGFCCLYPQCHPRTNKEREELYDRGCDIRRMSKVILQL